jgi:hypothetical protein
MNNMLNKFLLVWNDYNSCLDISVEKYVKYLEIIVKIRNCQCEFTIDELKYLKELVEMMRQIIVNIKHSNKNTTKNIYIQSQYTVCLELLNYLHN